MTDSPQSKYKSSLWKVAAPEKIQASSECSHFKGATKRKIVICHYSLTRISPLSANTAKKQILVSFYFKQQNNSFQAVKFFKIWVLVDIQFFGNAALV